MPFCSESEGMGESVKIYELMQKMNTFDTFKPFNILQSAYSGTYVLEKGPSIWESVATNDSDYQRAPSVQLYPKQHAV